MIVGGLGDFPLGATHAVAAFFKCLITDFLYELILGELIFKRKNPGSLGPFRK